MLQHTIDNVHQFAHHRADYHLLRLAARGQSCSKRLERRAAAHRGDHSASTTPPASWPCPVSTCVLGAVPTSPTDTRSPLPRYRLRPTWPTCTAPPPHIRPAPWLLSPSIPTIVVSNCWFVCSLVCAARWLLICCSTAAIWLSTASTTTCSEARTSVSVVSRKRLCC